MSTTVDVQRVVIPNQPHEWPELPPALVEALRAGGGTLWHTDRCVAVMDESGLFVRRRRCSLDCPVALFRRVLASRWFLIRNDSVPGYYPTCDNCGRVHTYMTLACVERPFNGLTEIYGVLNDAKLDGQNRVVEGFRYGALVPITAAEAAKYVQRIRDRGERI